MDNYSSILLLFLLLFAFNVFNAIIIYRRTNVFGSFNTDDRVIVYNKPHKTGCTYIQTQLKTWAKRHKIPFRKCTWNYAENVARFRECVPDGSPQVLAFHFYWSQEVKSILTEKFNSVFLLTSTRHPRMRIPSLFLQIKKWGAEYVSKHKKIFDKEFKRFISDMNWIDLFYYHTGEHINKTFPLSNDSKQKIHEISGKYHAVIDLDLKNESEYILKKMNLFSVFTGKMENVRGSNQLNLSKTSIQLIDRTFCAELELHKALLFRMSMLYDVQNDNQCNRSNYLYSYDLNSCLFEKSEAISL